MSIAKTLMSLSTWIEKHFPEKMAAAEVNSKLASIESAIADLAHRHAMAGDVFKNLNEANHALVARVTELERKADLTNSEMNKTKIMLLTQRQTAGR